MARRLGEQGNGPVSIRVCSTSTSAGRSRRRRPWPRSREPDADGEGSVVDVSRFETSLYSLSPADVLEEFLSGRGVPWPIGSGSSPASSRVPTAWCASAFSPAQHWHDLCSIIGQDDWADRMQEIQNDGPDRTEMLEVLLASWSRPLRSTDVIETHAGVPDPGRPTATDGKTMLEHPVSASGASSFPQPGASFRSAGRAVSPERDPVTIRRGAPLLGEDEPPSWSSVQRAGTVDDQRTGSGEPSTRGGPGRRPHRLPRRRPRLRIAAPPRREGDQDRSRRDDPTVTGSSSNFPEFGSMVGAVAALAGAEPRQGQPRARPRDRRGPSTSLPVSSPPPTCWWRTSARVVEGFGFGYEQLRATQSGDRHGADAGVRAGGPWRTTSALPYNIEQVGGWPRAVGRTGRSSSRPATST